MTSAETGVESAPVPEEQAQPDSDQKQIVYLWGAGATQAEISYSGADPVNLLMRDNDLGAGVATRILQKLPAGAKESFAADLGMDIEKLISLLAACNVAKYNQLAEDIRRLYFQDIASSLAAQVLQTPKLAIGLLSMHKSAAFNRIERLAGILTTNHDGLLQVAAQNVHGGVSIGVPFTSTDLVQVAGTNTPVILQLHGSFTWTFGIPLKVSLLTNASGYDVDTVWIPPAILKESKSYPFNKLAGMAYELLSKQCDVLRVVGSSLTQNDWNVLSMLFNAQRHRELTDGSPFRIELIMLPEAGDVIVDTCSYLQELTPIEHLSDGEGLADYKDKTTITDEMKNPLAFWMKQRVQFHYRNGHLGDALDPILAEIAGQP